MVKDCPNKNKDAKDTANAITISEIQEADVLYYYFCMTERLKRPLMVESQNALKIQTHTAKY